MNPVLLKPTGDRTQPGGRDGPALAAARGRRVPRGQAGSCDDRAATRSASSAARFDVVVARGRREPGRDQPARRATWSTSGWPSRRASRPWWSATSTGAGCSPHLFGTVELLPGRTCGAWSAASSSTSSGGIPALLGDGPGELERRTGVPTLGVRPVAGGRVAIDAEDSPRSVRTRVARSSAEVGRRPTARRRGGPVPPGLQLHRRRRAGGRARGRVSGWVDGPRGVGRARSGRPPGDQGDRGRSRLASRRRSSTEAGRAGAGPRGRRRCWASAAGYQMLGRRIRDRGGVEAQPGTARDWVRSTSTRRSRRTSAPVQRRGRERGSGLDGLRLRDPPRAGPGRAAGAAVVRSR